MSQARRILPRLSAGCLIAAVAGMAAATLAPDSTTDLVIVWGPWAVTALLVLAGVFAELARWPRRHRAAPPGTPLAVTASRSRAALTAAPSTSAGDHNA